MKNAINVIAAISLKPDIAEGEAISIELDESGIYWKGKVALSCCYEPDFEVPFLEATAKHYSDLANLFLKKHDCYTFLQEVKQTLVSEQQLAGDFVKPQT